VFIAGTLLAMVGQVMKTVSPGGLLYDVVLISTGVALQFALAYYLEWLSRLGRTATAGPAEPAATRPPAATRQGLVPVAVKSAGRR
jgi:hypothetical protein